MLDTNEIIKQYKPKLDALNIRVFSHQPWEDTILLRWWFTLNETGDINNLILPDARRLPDFLRIFSFPVVLFYTLDANNDISNAAWFVAVDNLSKHRAAYAALYCSPTTRGTRSQLHFSDCIYSLAFEICDALMGITWQQELLDIHTKMGYTIIGCIPLIHDEPFTYLVHLTKQNFLNSRMHRIAQRR